MLFALASGQAAIDEVAFATDDFLKLIPRAANRNEVDTYLRRSSINPITFPRHDADDTATLADDDDPGQAALDLQTRRKAVIDRCSKEIMRYDANFEILAEDLQDKIDGLAKTFMTKTGKTAFPYQPLTTAGKDITFRGKMDLETFRKFAASHPDALYSEMKLLSYFMIAENSQINQLHDIAAKLNLSVENLLVWCDTLNSEQVRFVQIDDDDDARDTDRTALAQAAQELVDANHKVDDLEKEITELNASIALLVRRQASPSSVHTSESTNSDKTRRSTKIDNVPIFHGDGDKDTLSFES